MLVVRRAAVLWLLAVFLFSGCGNPPVDQNSRYLVIDYNAESGEYEVVESTIETLDDPSAVAGEIAHLRGGGNIIAGDAEPTTEAEFEDALRVEGHEEPHVQYEVNDGVVEPWDFHSFLMLTLYHHLEKAAFYFESVGVDHDTVGRLPVYYAPSLSTSFIPINLLTDNAAYAFTLDAFLIPPRFFLDGLPLGANRGVIVHEYSHVVFNRLVHDDARAPEYLLEPWPDASINRMRSLDEGVADVFGALATGDANFIAPSIDDGSLGVDRDLSKKRYYTESLRTDLETSAPNSYDPYKLGSVVASTVWALRAAVDDETLGQSVVTTLRDFSEVSENFTLVDFFDLLHDNLPAGAQAEACQTFQDRLEVIARELACAQ